MTAFHIILAILIFGLLILIHEGGHYTAARLFHVTVEEFSIGMGPKLVSHVSKKSGIRYSLRALPIGGFVSMLGEDEESDDSGALCRKPVWQRMIITAAGAFMNLIVAFLIMTILVCSTKTFGGTQVAGFMDGATSCDYGLQEEDIILKVDNRRVHIATDLLYTVMHNGNKPVDVTVERDGETIVLEDVVFPTFTEQGHLYGERDFYIYVVDKTLPEIVKQSFWQCVNTVRMIYDSLFDMVGGEYTVEDMSGPVGITETVAEAADTSAYSLIYIVVFISVNLGIFNLLPLPALDGGRLFFQFIELIFRHPVPSKVEAMIHAVGLALLMLLMVYVTGHDIVRLIN